jgi:hypothetical protein
MALGAHYAAKRGKNEEVEQADEAVSFGRSGGVMHYNSKTEKSEKDGTAKLYDPKKDEKKLSPKGGFAVKKEEVEQIDEMDKSQPSSSRGAEGLATGTKVTPVTAKKTATDALKILKKKINPVKEEVEQIDESMMKALKKAQTKYKSAHRAAFGKDPTVKSAIVTGIAKLAGAKTKTALKVGAMVGGKPVSKQQQAAAASRVGKKGMFGMREEVVEKMVKGKKAAEKMTTKAAEARKKKIEGSANKVNMKPVMDLNKTGEK